jgi:three-Cys-motif partner protein
MPSKYRTTFFDEPREASLIKLRILEKYLTPWTSKVGSAAPGGGLCVLDCFAGRGDYLDGSAGSPRVILEHARSARYKIGCIFIEKKRQWASDLTALCNGYADVNSTVIHGDFREFIDEVTNLVQGRPLLMLVDPYGVKDLDYQKIGMIARSAAKCDLVVTFVDSAARRLASDYPREISQAIGPRIEGEDYGDDIRERLESSLASLRELHERVERYTGPFELPEPDDELRAMVERIVANSV